MVLTFYWLFSSTSMSLVLESSQLDTAFYMWSHQWREGKITPLHMVPLLLLKDFYILWPSLSQGHIADSSSACCPSVPPGYFLKSYFPVGWPQCLIIVHEVIPLRCGTLRLLPLSFFDSTHILHMSFKCQASPFTCDQCHGVSRTGHFLQLFDVSQSWLLVWPLYVVVPSWTQISL